MKSTSLSSRDMTVFVRKFISIREQFSKLNYSEVFWCLVAGIMSQGTMFGSFKPFGAAFYAAYAKSLVVKVLMTVSLFLACVIRGDLFNALKVTAVILVYEWLKKLLSKNYNANPIRNALFLSGAVLITGIFIFLTGRQSLDLLLVMTMEAVVAGTASSLFSITVGDREELPGGKNMEYGNMEYLGLLTLGAAILLGVSGIRFFGVQADKVAADVGLLMLTRHFGPGFGACAGVIAGMVQSTGSTGTLAAYTGIYAISGMTAGMLQKSKIASGTVFFVIHTLFMIISDDGFSGWTNIILPVALYLLLPDLKAGMLVHIRAKIEGNINASGKYDRIRKAVTGRLNDMSRALFKLGHSMEKRISDLCESCGDFCESAVEQLTQQVCSCCSRSSVCWKTQLFYTYKIICDLINLMQSDDTGLLREKERELVHFCVKSNLVTDILARTIELKRVEVIWRKEVLSSQSMIPEQIYRLSETLLKISAEVLQEKEHFYEEEMKINNLLRAKGMRVLESEVERSINGRFAVTIHFEDCKGNKKCPGALEGIVTEIIGVPMTVEEKECKNRHGDKCTVYLKEKEALGVTTGIARLKKDKSSVSGDSFTFLQIRGGKYVVAISDGMGSGKAANRLSETAIGLLEQLLDCGMSVRLALSFVNMMVGVGNSEKYATMDVCVIDLYTGETEFHKMGAMPSLVVNKRNLDFIQINNLPAGLHQEIPVQPGKRTIKEGEFIVMMTDGAYEGLSDGSESLLLEKIINRENTLNPQEMAEHLLKSACGGKEDITDDMTVLVAKLWRKAG